MRYLILLVIGLCGCAVSGEDYKFAEKACESHGGLKYYYVFPSESLYCEDGTSIDRWVRK